MKCTQNNLTSVAARIPHLGWLPWISGDTFNIMEANVDEKVMPIYKVSREHQPTLRLPHVRHHETVECVYHSRHTEYHHQETDLGLEKKEEEEERMRGREEVGSTLTHHTQSPLLEGHKHTALSTITHNIPSRQSTHCAHSSPRRDRSMLTSTQSGLLWATLSETATADTSRGTAASPAPVDATHTSTPASSYGLHWVQIFNLKICD